MTTLNAEIAEHAEALGESCSTHAGHLIDLLRHESSTVRDGAISGLRLYTGLLPEILEALLVVSNHDDNEVIREYAKGVYQEIRDKEEGTPASG